MAEKLTKIVVDCSTGEQSIIELNDEEIAQLEKDQANAQAQLAARQAAEEAKATKRASAISKLKALGLSEEEVAALL